MQRAYLFHKLSSCKPIRRWSTSNAIFSLFESATINSFLTMQLWVAPFCNLSRINFRPAQNYLGCALYPSPLSRWSLTRSSTAALPSPPCRPAPAAHSRRRFRRRGPRRFSSRERPHAAVCVQSIAGAVAPVRDSRSQTSRIQNLSSDDCQNRSDIRSYKARICEALPPLPTFSSCA